ncbi:hypothetical protein IU449_13495 [Nocardia higoensis]|uniref:Uncharacterized protein n=1 Tax=Nocardia higoensis TaxID=228599 RepID=A0ABS0DAQ6_9NOCA|nr:hypothetical protein [Nocardia higoensis]MBF6355545.1 hypothetical protein [Nocardia higoensis]
MVSSELSIWLVVSPVVVALLILLFGVLPAWSERRCDGFEPPSGRMDRDHPSGWHAPPFRPYTVAAARGVARAHACCSPERCGAKAAALSVLIAAGMTRYPVQRRRGGLWA